MLQQLNDYRTGKYIEANSTSWLINKDEKVIGTVNIRHSLSETLLSWRAYWLWKKLLLKEKKVMQIKH